MSLFSTSQSFLPDNQVQSRLLLSTQVLKQGRDRAVSFEGASQFTAQGVSACGLAAFNFARIGFRIEHAKRNLADILNELSTRDTVEEIVAICAGWSSNVHLEVDDIQKLPIFDRSLRLMSIEYGSPSQKHFQTLLENLNDKPELDRSTVMIITRPPEIIACFKFADATGGFDAPLYVVFDSHPRPSHPQGAGVSFSTSIESTARTLSNIFPPMDQGIFDMDDLQWQAQLLTNCSAHVFVGRHRRKDHEEAVVQSSLTILTLRAQISELGRENEMLSADKKQLQSEVGSLRAAVREEEARQRQAASSFPAYANRVLARSFGLISHAVAGPSRSGASGARVHNGTAYRSSAHDRSTDTSHAASIDRSRSARPSQANATTGASSIFAHNPPPMPYQPSPAYDEFDFDGRALDTDPDALWLQTARDFQNLFDSEDRRLRQEHEELTRHIQSTFQCSICMDELPVDDVAKVDECVHTMCRACLRAFVASKLQEHRYPIFCPMCTISAESNAQPGVISRFLIEQLGMDEAQFQILIEMELAQFTVQIHCRECRRPAFVDREDFSDMYSIRCPQDDCHHVWCKKCEQTIVADGPKHSCDGSSELDHLMKEKGWKHCPNCTTPIQKDAGCNHMTCISPGCNTHFCYICGGMIVRSALNQEINQAVSAHFRKCQLFEVPE